MSKIFEYIIKNREKKFNLISHKEPDGDAIGAVFAFKEFLKTYNIKSQIFLKDKPIDSYFMEDGDKEQIFYVKDFDSIPKGVNTLLDCSNIERTGLNGNLKNCDINIDHHHDNPNFATINVVDSSIQSTCQLLIQLYKELNIPGKKKNKINLKTANYLMLGLLYDTNYFQTLNTKQNVFDDAKFLMDLGVDIHYIRDKVFKIRNNRVYKTWGKTLENLIQVDNKLIAYSKMEWIQNKNDTTGLINFLSSTYKDVDLFIYLREDEEIIKGSVRSTNKTANKFAKTYGGGGHLNASGFTIHKNNKNLEHYLNEIKKEIITF